jgi:signal peptidase I
MIRLAGPKVMYLKRIVALAGDTVEFKNGVLYVNDKQAVEPYVVSSCDWNLPNRKVEPGNVYVVGDNRSMPIDGHIFGQTAITRIMGKPLW